MKQQVWPLTIGGLLPNLPKYAKVRWTWRQALSCLFPIVRCLALTPILACGVIITKPLHGSEWSFYNHNWQQVTHTLPEGKQQCEMGNTWQYNAPVHQDIYLSVTAYHRNSQVPITGTNILSSTLQYSAFVLINPTCFFVIPAAAEQNRQCLQLQIKFGIQYYGENLSIVAIICSSSVPTIPAESLTKSVNGPSRSVDEESVPATVLRGVRRWNATMWWTIHPASCLSMDWFCMSAIFVSAQANLNLPVLYISIICVQYTTHLPCILLLSNLFTCRILWLEPSYDLYTPLSKFLECLKRFVVVLIKWSLYLSWCTQPFLHFFSHRQSFAASQLGCRHQDGERIFSKIGFFHKLMKWVPSRQGKLRYPNLLYFGHSG